MKLNRRVLVHADRLCTLSVQQSSKAYPVCVLKPCVCFVGVLIYRCVHLLCMYVDLWVCVCFVGAHVVERGGSSRRNIPMGRFFLDPRSILVIAVIVVVGINFNVFMPVLEPHMKTVWFSVPPDRKQYGFL